jgi:hypothetical protein
LPHTVAPLEGLRIGQQKQKLGQLIGEALRKITEMVVREFKKLLK